MYATSILGTGSYLPEKILTNSDLESMVDTSHAWIMERTGIIERRVAAPGQVTSDLALIASQRALDMAGLKATDIDAIFFATVTPDQQMPSTACFLQNKLGCRPIMSFDLSAACSGFLYNLSLADQCIKTGMFQRILLVGAEILTRMINYKDRETCILFGDGAGAFVIGRSENPEASSILSYKLYADGSLSDLLDFPSGGSRLPFSHSVLDNGEHWLRMKGRDIFKNAVRAMSASCKEVLEQANLSTADIDWLIPHQANIRIIESVAEHLKIPRDKCVVNIERMGNNSAATIPTTLDVAVRDGRIQRGQRVLLTAFGSGLTYGAATLRF